MQSQKPIFCATHPRACSTAFERVCIPRYQWRDITNNQQVFMTRRDLKCVHEPFGDAYYFGPERMGYRYEGTENAEAREESGYVNSTYRSIFDRIAKDNAEVHMTRIAQSRVFSIHPPSVHIRACPLPTAISSSLRHFGAPLISRSIGLSRILQPSSKDANKV